ncbi:MAG: phosphotransacetylase family protein [Nodosilinea sp.]
MPSLAKRLVIGSTEPYSGKSAVLLGVGLQLQAAGMEIGFGKPMGSSSSSNETDPDLDFIVETMGLPPARFYPPSISLTETAVSGRLALDDQAPPHYSLQSYTEHRGEDLLLLEGPGSMTEGTLLSLSVAHIAEEIDAAVLLVTRYDSLLLVDRLLAAKAQLGVRLIGVVINDIPTDAAGACAELVRPFLESQGIPVLALLPRSPIMRSITVREIVARLNAEVLCSPNRLDLMVETLTIGAMNVNSALRYFRKATNMAVVTGGDRTDIQFAALETSTQCLVLTGQIPPSPEILERASDLEVPIVSVDSDTLSTVERIDELFGQVRLHEPVKVQCIQDLIESHFDTERLLQLLDLKLPVSAT